MDPYQGFEVGAEIELNDGPPVLEDPATVIVENKEDLPAWHHLQYIDESSSDESLDHQHMLPTCFEVKNMETPKYTPDAKTQSTAYNQLERMIFSTSEGLYKEHPVHVKQKDEQSVLWSNGYNGEHQDPPCQLAPDLEKSEMSLLDIVPPSNYSTLNRPTELYTEIVLSQQRDEAELLGKYSFYNARTQCAGTVKPWVRSHKCTKCGRQFGRMYNLESHMCIKTALNRVNLDDIMSGIVTDINDTGNKCEQSEESMNRLEKMCAEAQKELQELYKKEEEKPLLGISRKSHVQSTQVDRLVADNKLFKYKRFFTCDRCGRRFSRRFNLGFHVCCSDKNMSAPQNSIVIKSDNSIAVDVLHLSDKTSISQDIPSRSNSESLDHAHVAKIFKCQYCGKVYNRRASYGTHIRWHMKEKDLVSSVNKSLATGDLGTLLTTTDFSSVGLKNKTGPTFTCQECGRVFNKQCSYSTHTLWHIKRRNSGSSLAVPSVIQVGKTQEMRTPETQVPSISSQHHGSGGTKVIPDNTFTCQECGRVFYKRTAYSNHTRWHIKERELELSVKAATQTFLAGGDTKAVGSLLKKSSKGVSRKDLPISSLDNEHRQDYCNLVEHLNLEEQQNLYINEGVNQNRADTVDNSLCKSVEFCQQRTPAEVPEFVFELVVGTESFHESLTSKAVEVSETAENEEQTISTPQTSSLTSTTKKVNERPVPLSQVLPHELLGCLLKRSRPPYRCRDCGTCFTQSWKLKFHQHKSTRRTSSWKMHRCDCGRSMMGLLHFLRHQLQHLRDTTFICATCGKLLRGYQQLQAHSWVHPLLSQFHCKCGARFTQLSRYLWHCLLNKTRKKRHKQKTHAKT
ncbi:hypothetical protein GDO78_018239 [Eleutherodactylus coqui]|uniref:C2H2-type domain-containing protein n=1 Tax=Eleutherodactylus coqui TaxID=57060 RepID=A0A8J6K016_ELECQ|nr:hypothetical protein GDO78_018239 [Eleutherodactylus coqui]KAG9470285.1 hypothetical protein GDO78_018239 [Eleutherodactylus coqui]